MDFESLKNSVSNLTLYDLKAGVRKVQNAVMNYTEMESKVREATNNEPWGASSTMMNDIASATYNYQLLNEIMPMIYKRFTEKAAEEWRQIYKALQLLEFLIKNGSERVIDDARSHISLLKMLRQFHFIDQNGKDQGINVRNRAKELAELLSDVERIRAERKKARSNKNKYGGVEGGAGLGGGFSGASSSRYGGFGSEDNPSFGGGYTGGVYGDGGGFGGNESGFSDTQARRDKFEEYDEYDEGTAAPPPRRKTSSAGASQVHREVKKAEPPKPKQPEVDLFSFDEPAPASSSNGKQAAASNDFGTLQAGGADDDDDFDDFQSAEPAPAAAASTSSFGIAPPTSTTTSSTQFAAPQPRSGAQSANINDLFSSISPAPSISTPTAGSAAFSPPPIAQQTAAPFKQAVPSNYQASQPNYFTSISQGQSAGTPTGAAGGLMTPTSGAAAISPGIGGGKKPAGGDAFSSLLSGTSFASKSGTPTGTKGLSMADMAKQKASAGMWGPPAPGGPSAGAAKPKTGSAFDDLLG